jgi:hypothetical protein
MVMVVAPDLLQYHRLPESQVGRHLAEGAAVARRQRRSCRAGQVCCTLAVVVAEEGVVGCA